MAQIALYRADSANWVALQHGNSDELTVRLWLAVARLGSSTVPLCRTAEIRTCDRSSVNVASHSLRSTAVDDAENTGLEIGGPNYESSRRIRLRHGRTMIDSVW